MAHDLARVSARLFNAPLLALPDTAMTIASNLAARFGVAPMKPPAAPKSVKAEFGDGDDDDEFGGPAYKVIDGIAVISIRGELVNRGSWMDSFSGLVAYETLGATLRKAEADGAVEGIILDMDSPGGEAAGCMECAAIVRAVSKTKPVTAFVNSLAASAAYAIAAGASEIVVTPSAVTGSIGVIWLHMDFSKSLAQAGIKPTILTEGDFKKDGNQLEPLEPAAKARIQATIRSYYDLFVESVGTHRPKLGANGARATEAGVYVGQAGVDAGLADRVGSMDAVLDKMSTTRATRRAAELQASQAPARGDSDMAVKLYKAGESHADSLIEAGKVDKTSSWSFSAEDGDALLGSGGDDWSNYAKFHLGQDDGEKEKTKARFKYPHGKDGKVYRSALVAIRSRAAQQDVNDIYEAAGRLLEKIDGDKEKESATMDQLKLTAAHAEGLTEGLAQGAAEGAAKGVADERARIKSILGCEEAKGREATASHLAMNTSMSLEDAKGILAAIPVAPAPSGNGSRMQHAPKPPIKGGADSPDADPQAGVDAMWGGISKKLNATLSPAR